MGSEETPSDGSQPSSHETTNVVRIPRDWFGPREELVPFGPRAFHGQAEQEATVANELSDTEAPLDPNAFWGEDATFIHGAVEGPAGPSPAPRGRLIYDLAAVGARWRAVGSAIAVVLIASVGLGAWALHRALPRAQRSLTASATSHQLEDARQRAVSTPSSSGLKQPRTHARRPVRHRARPVVTAVVYHPSQATYSPPSGVGSSAAAASTTSGGTAGGGTNLGTTAAPKETSQPAFGANGALGPVSSPYG